MNRTRYFLILFFFPLLLQAQDTIAVYKDFSSPIIKFSPLSLIESLQSVQFALEHQLGGRISLQHEAGYIYKFDEVDIWGSSDPYLNTRGVRLRNEIRYYFDPKPKKLEGGYFAGELLYNFLRFDKSTSVGRDCNGSWNCQYYEYMYYRAQKQVFALHLKVGYQALMANRLVLDIYGGYGGRHLKELNLHPPEGLQPNDRFNFTGEKYIDNRISLSLGFKLGYLLVKREPPRPEQYYPDGDYPYYIEQ